MLDLSAAFDTVDHTILLKRLSISFGIGDQALQWFTSYLTGRFQSVHFAGKTSSSTLVSCGVPQGSVLGPLLFLLYTADIGSIASKYNITSHSFADDTQLYLSGDPSEVKFLRSSTVACINEITEWCAANKLKLNPNKTEFLWSATARRQDQLDYMPIHLSEGDIRPSKVVRNLGVLIDSQLSFSQHVNNITSKSYSELRRLKSFRRSLPLPAARTLVNSLVVSRIDYCNCLLAGAPAKITDKLQSVMNAAAKIVCGLEKYDHIKKHMRDTLHWLPVPQRVTYKLCLLTYKTIHSKAPEYLIELCKPVCWVRIKASPKISLQRRPARPENNFIVCWSSIYLCRTKSLEQSAAGIEENKNTWHVQETFENALIQTGLWTMNFLFYYYYFIFYITL